LALAVVLAVGLTSSAAGQFKDASEDRKGPRIGQGVSQRFQAGIVVTAESGPCSGILGTAAIPIDWPEQEVHVAEEDVSPTAQITYQMLEGTVKVMVVRIPRLPAGQQAKALVTLEIKRSPLLPPKRTDIYRLPNPRRLPREIRPYLGPSPKIEATNPKIKALARQIVGTKQNAWEQVEALYDYVREKVQQKSGPLKGALAALRDGVGNHEDLAAAFIALCRAADIPARTVWVPKYCYPEFYLVDDEGVGHWFPCQVAGKREFGGISETGPILAKGDSFRAAQNPRERQRFPAESVTGEGSPKVQSVRKLLSE